MNQFEKRNVTSASGAANFLLERDGDTITNMKLNKLLYIAHGLTLATINRPLLNQEYYEYVEAWKYGPVIPSIYHELRQFGKDCIGKDHRSLLLSQDPELGASAFEPVIEDKCVLKILEWTSRAFGHMEASRLVRMTHNEGSPWSDVYLPGAMGMVIKDEDTKHYYAVLRKVLKDRNLYYGEDICD